MKPMVEELHDYPFKDVLRQMVKQINLLKLALT